MTDDWWTNSIALIGAHIEKCRAFGRADPFVKIGSVIRRSDCANVERYLFQPNNLNQNGGWTNFYENVATLPLDASSMFIRSVGGSVPGGPGGMRLPNVLSSMQDTLAAVENGRIQTYNDVVSISR